MAVVRQTRKNKQNGVCMHAWSATLSWPPSIRASPQPSLWVTPWLIHRQINTHTDKHDKALPTKHWHGLTDGRLHGDQSPRLTQCLSQPSAVPTKSERWGEGKGKKRERKGEIKSGSTLRGTRMITKQRWNIPAYDRMQCRSGLTGHVTVFRALRSAPLTPQSHPITHTSLSLFPPLHPSPLTSSVSIPPFSSTSAPLLAPFPLLHLRHVYFHTSPPLLISPPFSSLQVLLSTPLSLSPTLCEMEAHTETWGCHSNLP